MTTRNTEPSFHPANDVAAGGASLYRRLWRWHFYAGLFVLPFVALLALSGTIYLFKPQIERWEERAFQQLNMPAVTASPAAQVDAALRVTPGATFHSYRLPARPDDAAMVHLAKPDGTMRDVFVAPDGQVAGSLDPDTRIVEFARRLHGELLMGQRGSWLVEIAACWAIVLIVTGLFLWWPRGRGPGGVLWPRRGQLLRDLHAVTGFWVSTLALVLLLTGLPWTDAWGNGFRLVREQMGWVQGPPAWSIAAPEPAAHAAHDHDAMHAAGHPAIDLAVLDRIIAQSSEESLAFPTFALAPGAALFGPPATSWTLTSLVQNRPLGLTLTFDAATGAPLTRDAFADRHPIDRAVGYGLAWHEGALFGPVNQAIGVITALALLTMSVTGFLMWRRRRPTGALGAPPLPRDQRKPAFVAVTVVVLACLLPMLALSLVALWLIDLVLPRVSPRAAAWLGMVRTARS